MLFEAAWENEKVINGFRIVFGFVMGVPSVSAMIFKNHTYFGSAWSLIAWALCAVALMFVLRRWYHRGLSFVLSAADATTWMLGLYLFYLEVNKTDPAEARNVLGGLGLVALFVIGINAARFSAAVAVWSAVYSFALYVALTHAALGTWSPSYIFEGIQFAAFAGLLVLTSRRLRKTFLRERERELFARFLPAQAVERLVRDPSQLKLDGENHEATVLFSDIRGFTTLSATLRPDQIWWPGASGPHCEWSTRTSATR